MVRHVNSVFISIIRWWRQNSFEWKMRIDKHWTLELALLWPWPCLCFVFVQRIASSSLDVQHCKGEKNEMNWEKFNDIPKNDIVYHATGGRFEGFSVVQNNTIKLHNNDNKIYAPISCLRPKTARILMIVNKWKNISVACLSHPIPFTIRIKYLRCVVLRISLSENSYEVDNICNEDDKKTQHIPLGLCHFDDKTL